MKLDARIEAFAELGDQITGLPSPDLETISLGATRENAWFTSSSVTLALAGISKFLNEGVLRQWTSSYSLDSLPPKTVGVVMAGNIPLVGFHDFLCVLISGNRLKAKLSSQDSFLLTYVAGLLMKIEPGFQEQVEFADRLNHIDAVIATGSDNTARYFEYYFRNIPRIVRKNRTSVAVLSGSESSEELFALGNDVFTYFGLGCRNVSKLYVPEGYDFKSLFEAWEKHATALQHHKFTNNYDYQKSILLVNRSAFLDNGFILLKEDSGLVSPISTVYFEYYQGPVDLQTKLRQHVDKIQCLVSAEKWFDRQVHFGQAQFPEVSDYADKVDTLEFLV